MATQTSTHKQRNKPLSEKKVAPSIDCISFFPSRSLYKFAERPMDSRTPSAIMCWIYLKCVCTSPFTFLICFCLFVIFLVTHCNPISIHCHLMGHAELHPLHQSHANDLAGLSRGVKETFKKAIGIKNVQTCASSMASNTNPVVLWSSK